MARRPTVVHLNTEQSYRSAEALERSTKSFGKISGDLGSAGLRVLRALWENHDGNLAYELSGGILGDVKDWPTIFAGTGMLPEQPDRRAIEAGCRELAWDMAGVPTPGWLGEKTGYGVDAVRGALERLKRHGFVLQ